MANYKIKSIDVLSSFKYGVVFGAAVCIASAVLLFVYTIFHSIISAFGPKIFIVELKNGLIEFFFSVIMLAFLALLICGISALSAYIYNVTVGWTGGVDFVIEENTAKEEDESESKGDDDMFK